MNHTQVLIDLLVGWLVPLDGENHPAAVFHARHDHECRALRGTAFDVHTRRRVPTLDCDCEPELIVDTIPAATLDGQVIPMPGWGTSTAKRYVVRRKLGRGRWEALTRDDIEIVPKGTVSFDRRALRHREVTDWAERARMRVEAEKQQRAAERLLADMEANLPPCPRDLKKRPVKIRFKDKEA